MFRIKKNKPKISDEVKPFRTVRRLNVNPTYMPLKIGAGCGYFLLGLMSASSSMCGIVVGAVLRVSGF